MKTSGGGVEAVVQEPKKNQSAFRKEGRQATARDVKRRVRLGVNCNSLSCATASAM